MSATFFYPKFTNVLFNFLRVFVRFDVFLNFHLNVYYIYAVCDDVDVAGKESLREEYTQDAKLGFVVNAIYTMAHALDSMYRDICGVKSAGLCDAMKPVNGSVFIRYLINASFISYSGDSISFDAAGDPTARYGTMTRNLS